MEHLSKLPNPSDWDNREWIKVAEELALTTDKTKMHRKNWEWIQCIYGLKKLGYIKPDFSVLGVGCGHEPVIYYFTNYVKKVVATDVYDGSFAEGSIGGEANSDMLTNPDKYAPFPYKRERLVVERADGTNLPYEDNTFDIVFSLCAIEHFGEPRDIGNQYPDFGSASYWLKILKKSAVLTCNGDFANLLKKVVVTIKKAFRKKAVRTIDNSAERPPTKAMKEIARVLKHGGIAVISTEYLLNDKPHGSFFSKDRLFSELIIPSKLKLIDEINFSMPDSMLKKPIKLPEEMFNVFPHLVLQFQGALFTSVILFLVK